MTPDAGSSGKVSKNRGYVAIPEVGDQVMVGFVHNHPDRPFVMGSMFHGKVGLGGGVNNHMRSIQTKSGIKILMNDDEKSITIKDPSGNTWYMDGQGNIEVTAPKNITLNAGENLDINVGQNMTTNVGANQSNIIGNNINTSAGNDIIETAMGNRLEMSDNRTEIIDKNYERQSDIFDIVANKIIASSQDDIIIQSAKTVYMNSGENSNLF